MPNYDFNEIVVVLRPPAPEVPRAEQLAIERKQAFHSHEPGMAPRGPESPAREFRAGEDPIAPGPLDRAEVCVLDERGGHLRLGAHCPHFRNFDRDEIITVDL